MQIIIIATKTYPIDISHVKPLQGSLFRQFRNMILGIVDNDIGLYKENNKQALIMFGLVES